MRSLEQLDRWIARKVKDWSSRVSGGGHQKALLEIRRDILEDVRDQIEPKGEGKSVFPYNRIAITVGEEVLAAALSDDGSLLDDIRGLLVEAGCRIPDGFDVTVASVQDPELAASERPFLIEYARSKPAAPAARGGSQRPAARLTVVRGQADPPEFAITGERVNLGRLREVMGEREGLRRRNDIAFDESETTVSREHAVIRYDAASARFRVFDSNSQRGTSVFRDGRRLAVPKGGVRGVQLHNGDEIHLGDARVRFEQDLTPPSG